MPNSAAALAQVDASSTGSIPWEKQSPFCTLLKDVVETSQICLPSPSFVPRPTVALFVEKNTFRFLPEPSKKHPSGRFSLAELRTIPGNLSSMSAASHDWKSRTGCAPKSTHERRCPIKKALPGEGVGGGVCPEKGLQIGERFASAPLPALARFIENTNDLCLKK